MAEESKVVSTEEVSTVETTDRGLFDFMGKKKGETKPQEEVIVAGVENLHVSDQEAAPKVEEKQEIPEMLHRSNSSSSSSSSDGEEEVEGREKKKKKKKEKISGEEKPEGIDTSVPIEKCEEPAAAPEEKKGFLDKMKEKLPGQHKKPEEVPPPVPAVECGVEGEPKAEKKGILEKIKEKLPGYHPKTSEEKGKESH